MFAGKPIIGLAGGIGSGKSFIARLFAELGCRVIDSDEQVRRAYGDADVRETLRQWWGPQVFTTDGAIDRRFIARTIFADPEQRHRLEQLLHPKVNALREREMKESANDPKVLAFVWDTPLLFEAGLSELCDFIVFIDTPPHLRQQRVHETRGWKEDELKQRENLQWPLDKKRRISDYVLSNTADAAQARDQVRDLIPRILAQVAKQSATGGR